MKLSPFLGLILAIHISCTLEQVQDELAVPGELVSRFRIDSINNNSYIPAKVLLTNLSVGGSSFRWDFGDGRNSLLENPSSHEYFQSGEYTIRLEVSDSMGRKTFSDTTIIIREATTFRLVNNRYVWGWDLIQFPNGSFLVSTLSAEGDRFLWKINEDGSTDWEKKYTDPIRLEKLTLGKNGTFWAAGRFGSPSNISLTEFDFEGNPIGGTKLLGGIESERLYDLITLKSGKIVLAVRTESFGFDYDIWVIVLEEDGEFFKDFFYKTPNGGNDIPLSVSSVGIEKILVTGQTPGQGLLLAYDLVKDSICWTILSDQTEELFKGYQMSNGQFWGLGRKPIVEGGIVYVKVDESGNILRNDFIKIDDDNTSFTDIKYGSNLQGYSVGLLGTTWVDNGMNSPDKVLLVLGGVSETGELLWVERYESENDNLPRMVGQEIINTLDGGYLIIGSASDQLIANERSELFVIKTNSEGKEEQ